MGVELRRHHAGNVVHVGMEIRIADSPVVVASVPKIRIAENVGHCGHAAVHLGAAGFFPEVVDGVVPDHRADSAWCRGGIEGSLRVSRGINPRGTGPENTGRLEKEDGSGERISGFHRLRRGPILAEFFIHFFLLSCLRVGIDHERLAYVLDIGLHRAGQFGFPFLDFLVEGDYVVEPPENAVVDIFIHIRPCENPVLDLGEREMGEAHQALDRGVAGWFGGRCGHARRPLGDVGLFRLKKRLHLGTGGRFQTEFAHFRGEFVLGGIRLRISLANLGQCLFAGVAGLLFRFF